MPRCQVCDAEYIHGEITCKTCDTDLPQDTDASQMTDGPATNGEVRFDPFREVTDVGSSRGEEPKVPIIGDGASIPGTSEPEKPPGPQPPPPPAPTSLCPECGAAIDKTSQFCDSCGTPLGKPCPDCGVENKAGAKFCFKCGNPLQKVGLGLSSPPPEGKLSLVILGRDGGIAGRCLLREGENKVGVKAEGSFPDVDLTSVDLDEVISRKHAVIVVRSGMVSVFDLGSTNGTKVDGTVVTRIPVALRDNSDVVFANIHCRISRG